MKISLCRVIGFSLGLCVLQGGTALAAPKPNIVHFLIDDLGWQDIQAHRPNGEGVYETPHLNKLTKNGMRFTQAYSPAPTCAPSRVAYMAGQWPTRTKVIHVMGGSLNRPWNQHFTHVPPFYPARLPQDTPNLAQMMKRAGYVTGHLQKWHAGGRSAGYPGPTDYGFDFGWDGDRQYNDPEFWPPENPRFAHQYLHGIWAGMRPHRLSDFPTHDEDDPYRLDANYDDRPFDGGVDLAIKWLNKHKEKPFFLNYATFMVHGPIGTRDKKRLEYYCKKMGKPFPTDPGSIHKEKSGQLNPYYAAMVDSLDWMIGKVITHLEETDDPRNPGHKLIDNTYIILSSDNGGVTGHPAKNLAGKVEHEQVTDNAPLQQGKQSPYEGGIRIPFIVQGPGVEAGTTKDAIVSLIDMFPTFLAMAGTEPDPSLILDGCNMLPLLKGEAEEISKNGKERDTLYFHYPIGIPMASAIRKGDWKLILNYASEFNKKPVVGLYRMQHEDGSLADIGEENNLAESQPEIRDDLLEDLQGHLEKFDAARVYKNPENPRWPAEEKDRIPAILRSYSEGDVLTTHFEAGEGKSKITEAKLLYTTNGSDFVRKNRSYEEWFEAPAEIKGGKVVALAPPGMTHAVFYLRDENNFMVTSQPIPSETAVQQTYSITETFTDAFNYKPGLVAMVKAGESAVRSALVAGENIDALNAALSHARSVLEQPVAEEPYAKAIRAVRKEIRAFKGTIPEASLAVMNQFRLKDW